MNYTARLALLSVLVAGAFVPTAQAIGPGGWNRVGVGATPTAPALNNDVLALNTEIAGQMLVAGKFTNAGGVMGRNRIARWDGTAWSSIGPLNTFGADIKALATEPGTGRIFAGGVFTNAGGDANADHLAVWNGTTWAPFCVGVDRIVGNVNALKVMGGFLYVGGEFQDGFGIAAADYLLRCDLGSGAVSVTTTTASFPGPVYALATNGAGSLYAGGNFNNLEGNTASDHVARYTVAGGWTNLGSGGPNGGAVASIVRALDSSSTDLFIGSDSSDIAGIPKADHVAGWNGTSWYSLGSNSAGTDGYLPATAPVLSVLVAGSFVYVSGDWTNADGNPASDFIAEYNGASWGSLGTNGSGDGPLNAKAEALTWFGTGLHAGGNFTSAGGDALAKYVARYVPGFVLPSNLVRLPKYEIIKKKGIALLTVKVPGPGELIMLGKGIKHPDRAVAEQGKVLMKVRPTHKTKKKLKDKGFAKVRVMVTFTPTDGLPRTESIKVRLVLKAS